MLAMAEANGEVAVQDPDQLVKQIERTRENLARTIDTLTERVNPANVTKRAMSKVLDQASRTIDQASAMVSGRPARLLGFLGQHGVLVRAQQARLVGVRVEPDAHQP